MIQIPNLDYIGFIIAILMLTITAYMDIRTREIDPRIWIPFIVIGIAFTSIKIYLGHLEPLYLALNMIAPLMIAILGIQGMIGFADFFALLAISLLITSPLDNSSVIPPSIIILLLTNLIVVIGSIIPFTVLNIKHYKYIKSICGSTIKTLIIIATSRVISIEKYLSTSHYYPLVFPRQSKDNTIDSKNTIWECRTSFLIDEEPEEYRKEFEYMATRKIIDPKTRIAVAWGIPYIIFILIATALYPLSAGIIENILRSAISKIFIN